MHNEELRDGALYEKTRERLKPFEDVITKAAFPTLLLKDSKCCPTKVRTHDLPHGRRVQVVEKSVDRRFVSKS